MGPRTKLATLGLAAIAVRLAIIATTADVDTDAYGHFAIARALVAEPTNLHAHWVWLPGYHFLLWLSIHFGAGFTTARVMSAILQAAAPLLLFDYVARRGGEDPSSSRDTASLAALMLTIAPLSNRLATSAQAETTFALLVLASAWAVERRRAVLAGSILSAACLVRYEAWGAIASLAVGFAWRRDRRAIDALAFLLPACAVASWIVLRRVADGSWLLFVRETHAFASGVRAATATSIVDRVLYPIALPLIALGPAIALAPLGLRRSIRVGWLIPLGLASFLLASYAGRGALGLERYLTALVPFACVAIADGVLSVKRASPRLVARAALAALCLTTIAHLGWLVHRARSRDAELRGYERAMSPARH